jgi:hypothetical protein
MTSPSHFKAEQNILFKKATFKKLHDLKAKVINQGLHVFSNLTLR